MPRLLWPPAKTPQEEWLSCSCPIRASVTWVRRCSYGNVMGTPSKPKCMCFPSRSLLCSSLVLACQQVTAEKRAPRNLGVRNVSAHSELGQGSEINKQGENTMNLPIA